MFGIRKRTSTKDTCKCTTKNETQTQEKRCHNTKASDMTSGSRSTKSCSGKGAKSCSSKSKTQTKSCKGLSNANTKSCVAKSSARTTDCN